MLSNSARFRLLAAGGWLEIKSTAFHSRCENDARANCSRGPVAALGFPQGAVTLGSMRRSGIHRRANSTRLI